MNEELYTLLEYEIETLNDQLKELNINLKDTEHKDNYLKITERIDQDLKMLLSSIQLERMIALNPERAEREI